MLTCARFSFSLTEFLSLFLLAGVRVCSLVLAGACLRSPLLACARFSFSHIELPSLLGLVSRILSDIHQFYRTRNHAVAALTDSHLTVSRLTHRLLQPRISHFMCLAVANSLPNNFAVTVSTCTRVRALLSHSQ